MAERTPDVELLFGVSGGGSINGESGRLIKSQIEAIMSVINNKPISIKVNLDEASIKSIKQEIQKAVSDAKVAVKVSKSTATATTTGEKSVKKRSTKLSSNSSQAKTIKAGTTEAESSITKVNKSLSSLIGALEKASSSEESSWSRIKETITSFGKASQSEIEDTIASLASLRKHLENDKASSEELSKAIIKASNVASKMNLTSKTERAASDSSNIQKETKEYYSSLEKIYNIKKKIAEVKDNTAKSESGSTLATQEANIGTLEDSVIRGTISQSDFDTKIAKIKSELAKTVAGAKVDGNYGRSTKTIESGTAEAENSIARLNKSISSLIGLWDKSSSVGKSSQLEIEKTISYLASLRDTLETGKISYEEYSQAVAKANKVASKINLTSKALDLEGGGSNVQTGTKEYYSALEKVYDIKRKIADVKDNTVKDGAKAASIIKEQEESATALEEAIKNNVIGYSDLDEEITKIKASLAGVVTNAKANGNYGKLVESTRLFAGDGATIKEIKATITALKQLASLKKIADKGKESTFGISTYEDSYGKFSELGEGIKSLSERLDEGKMTADEFNEEFSKLSYNATIAKKKFDELSKSSEDGSGVIQRDIKKVSTLMSSLQNMQNKYTKAAGLGSKSRESYNQIGKLYNQLSILQTQRLNGQISSGDFEASYSKIALEAKKAEESIKAVGEATMSVGSKVKSMFTKFSAWFSISQITMYAVRSAKQMVTNVIDIDSAMTELKKVTDETDRAYTKFLDGASTRAKNLGVTITDIISSTADFARLGYDINTASVYADAANVYKNVGDGIQDISEASESIISTVKAFSEYENNPMSIVDKFNEVGNNFAISSQGIGEALKRSASSLATAGNTLDESIGLITAANSVIQDPDSVGTSLKTISMYLRAAKTDAEAAGEETDGMANSVSELRSEILQLTNQRVDIMLDSTTFKSTYQILKELSEVWNDLSDVDTANILELIGGKRNGNVITSLIKNFNLAEKAANTSANDSEGSALRENEKQLESVQGKLNRLETSFQDLSNTVIDSGFLKILIDSGTTILDVLGGSIKFLEQINGIIPAIITGITGIKALTQNVGVFTVDKNNTKLKLNKGFSIFGNYNQGDVSLASDTDKLGVLVERFNALQESADSLGTESYTKLLAEVRNESDALADSMTTLAATSSTAKMSMADAFDATYGGTTGLSNVKKLVESYNALGDGTGVQTAKQKALADQIGRTNENFGSYISGLNGAKASISGYGGQLVAAKAKTIALTVASTALNMAISLGVSAGISALASFVTYLVNVQEEARKEAVENAKAYEDQKKQIEDLKNKYIEIMDSEKDEATKAKELDTIKNTLAETYGVEKEALDKLNESRQAGLDLINKEAVADAKSVISENQVQYNKYSKEAMDTETGTFSYYYKKTGNDATYAKQNDATYAKQEEQDICDYLSRYGISANVEYDNRSSLHSFAFEYGKDAYSAYENISNALSELSKKEQKEGLNPAEQAVIDQLRIDFDKLKKYLYDSETGIDNIMSSTADAYWQVYSSDFEEAGNKAFENIDTLDGLEQWKQGFIDSIGDFANDPFFSQYIEKIFNDKKWDIQKAASETEQSITYPTVSIKELNDKLDETSEKLEKITTSASKVQSALKSAFSKESFSVDEVLSLIELMPDITDKFKMNDDGTFSINYKDLQSGAESYIATQKQEIDTTNDLVKAKIKELEANIALNKSRLLTSINSKSDYEYNQNIKSAISTDEDNLATLKAQLSEGQLKSEYLAKVSADLSSSFSAVIDVLTDRYKVIADVEDAIADNGSITLDTLNKIKDVYPELSDEVSNYMMGLIDEQSLLGKLKDAYENDFYAYRDTIAQKIDLTNEELQSYLNALNTKYAEDENYYNHLGATSKNFIDYMKDNYALDLDRCKTWCDAKFRMQAQTAAKVKALAGGINIEDYYDFETGKKIGDWSELYAANGSVSGLAASGVLGEINNILSAYGDGIKEFGALFKSTSTLDGVKSSSSKSSKSTKSSTSEVFDWIEVRLDRLATKTKSFFDKVSDYVSNVTNERNLSKAIKSTQNEISANKTAEQKYRAKANSINLSESWRKKVREGNFSIDELTDETLIKNIQDYQKWWEKAEESAQNISALTEQRKDYLSQQFDSKYERQQRITDRYSTANDKINDNISYKQTAGQRVTASDYTSLNKNLTAQNKSLAVQNNLLLAQQKTVEKGSAKWQEYQDKIDSNSQSIRQNTEAIAENNNKKYELKIADYERIAENYSRSIDVVQNKISLLDAQGKKVGTNDYKSMISNSQNQNRILEKERNAIIQERKSTRYGSERYDELTESLRNVDDQITENKKNQAEWNATIRNLPIDRLNEYLDIAEAVVSHTKAYIERLSYINGESTVSAKQIRSQKYTSTDLKKQSELVSKYQSEFLKAKQSGRDKDADEYQKLLLQANSTYNEMLKANEELERQARDIELYRNFEKDLQHIDDVKKALSSLSDMINDNALYNDDGSFSEQGIAKIALTMKNLEEAKSSADDYKKEIDILNKAHKQGKYNDDEYAEKLRELTEGYQNATSEINQYTEAIKDLYKNQAQEELNALNELIDARSKALQKKKEYYDYDKTIKNKTKDITAVQMQIEALNGVSTAEAKAQKALLEEQLSDLEQDLADTQAEHIYQVQIDGLNEQKEILQDIYDKFVDSLNKCLDTEKDIVNSASLLAVNSIDAVNKLLRDIANARGFDIGYINGVQNAPSIPHFADGGKVVTVGSKNGDDGIAWLKAGEIVLTKEISNAFMKTIPQLNLLSVDLKKTLSSGSISSNNTPSVSFGDIQFIVQGNVDRDVMNDLKKYQKQITDSVITNITNDLRKVGYKR